MKPLNHLKLISILVTSIVFCSVLISWASVSELEEYEETDISAYSVNPPPQRTGAPGENDCTQCHSGNTYDGNNQIDVTFSGGQDEYLPDSTYTITIGVPNNQVNGFQMTILDDNALKAGEFISGTGSSVVNSGLRQYVNQTNDNNNSWSFEWTAPSTSLGNLTAYYSFNKSDNSGNVLGDSIFLGQKSIFESSSLQIKDHPEYQTDFKIWQNVNSNELQGSIYLDKTSQLKIDIYDITGKTLYASQVQSEKGLNDFKIELDNNLPTQIIILGVHVNGEFVGQKKIMFQNN